MHQAAIPLTSRFDAGAARPLLAARNQAEAPPCTGLFVGVLLSALLWSAPAGAIIWLLG